MHDAVRRLKTACDEARPPLTLAEASLRWILNHSALREGDAIIIGAKNVSQLESNTAAVHGGPLSDDLVAVIEEVWEVMGKSKEEVKI